MATRRVIEEGEDGSVVVYEESQEERANRIDEWARQAASELTVTKKQASTFATRARRRRAHA